MTAVKNMIFFLVLSNNLNGMELVKLKESPLQNITEELKILRNPEFNKTVTTLMGENLYYPVVFGGKNFHIDQIANLNEEQRKIFYENVNPSGLAKCLGGRDVMYTENIEEFKKKMPQEFIKGIRINARTKMCCTGWYPYYAAAASALPGIGGLIVFASHRSNPHAPLLVGLLCSMTVMMEAGVFIAAKLSPFCCYFEKDYVFNDADEVSGYEASSDTESDV